MMKELEIIGNETVCTSAVIVKKEKVLLGLRNYSQNKLNGASVWTTPGGRCFASEKIKDNLLRETLEETGIDDLRVIDFLGKVPAVGNKGDVLYVFHCTTDQDARLTEPEKFSKWEWFSVNKIPENFINPKILPLLKTIAAE